MTIENGLHRKNSPKFLRTQDMLETDHIEVYVTGGYMCHVHVHCPYLEKWSIGFLCIGTGALHGLDKDSI